MPLQAQWATVTVTHPDTNEDTYVHRGGYLPDWVDEYTRFVLTTCGAVQEVPDRPVEDVDTSLTNATPVTLQEHPPVQPTEVMPEELTKPSTSDDKDTWIAYAIDPRNPDRIAKSTAVNMSKQAIMDRFRR